MGDPGVRRSRQEPGRRAAFAYLASLRRADGSYRYSKRYAVTPVWVTSQVLPALARKPFPLVRLAAWRARVTASIVTIGNELLSGDTVNTNAAWLAQQLEELGVASR